MEYFTQPILLAALAFVLALFIERLLELIRAVEDHIDAKRGNMDKWQKKADELRARIELRLDHAKESGDKRLQQLLSLAFRYIRPANGETDSPFAISADQLRSMSLSLRNKVIGVVLGILFASSLEINMFTLVDSVIQFDANYAIKMPRWLGIAISGIAMGLGAGPVHKLIVALERTRANRR